MSWPKYPQPNKIEILATSSDGEKKFLSLEHSWTIKELQRELEPKTISVILKENMTTKERPKVGLAVFVCSLKHPNCVILGKRKGSLGEGTYAPPGGHLEFGESFEECAKRETMEETDLKLQDVVHETTVNIVWSEENYHYIDIVMKADVDFTHKEEPSNMEPHKCEGWEWFDWDNFPPEEQLFEPLKRIRQTGYSPFKRN